MSTKARNYDYVFINRYLDLKGPHSGVSFINHELSKVYVDEGKIFGTKLDSILVRSNRILAQGGRDKEIIVFGWGYRVKKEMLIISRGNLFADCQEIGIVIALCNINTGVQKL